MKSWFKRNCRFYFFVVLHFFISSLFAQETGEWIRFGLDEGLSNLQVNDIDQCDEGFIWLATNEGLRRFDGEFFVNMPAGKSSVIQNSTVTSLAIDNGLIWMTVTNRGLYRFNIRDNSFDHIPLQVDTHQVLNIHEILIREDKVYLSLLNLGIIILDKNGPFSNTHFTEGLGSVMSTIPLKNDSVLVSQLGVGLIELSHDLVYDIKKNILPISRPIDQNGYSTYTCEELVFEKKNVWLGCWDNALHKLTLDNRHFQSYLLPNEARLRFNSNEIVALSNLEDDLLVATKFGELFRFDKEETTFSPFELLKFKGKKINKLFVADDKRLWVGTNHGLYTLEETPDLFTIFPIQNKNKEALQINVLTTINDTIYIGCNEGLYQLINNKIQKVKVATTDNDSYLKEAFENQPVHSLLQYKQSLFVGTNKTVYQLERGTNKIRDIFDCEIIRAEPNYFVPNDNKFSRYSTMAIQDTEHGKFLWAFAYGHFMTFYHLEENWGGYTKCYSNYQENLMQRLVVDEQNVLHGLGKRLGYFKGLKTHFVSCEKDEYFYQQNFKNQCYIEFVSLQYEELWDMKKWPLLNSNDFRQIIFHNTDRLLCTSSGLYQMNPKNEIQSIPLPYNDIQNALKSNNQLWLISNGRLLNLNLADHKSKIFSEKNGIPESGLSAAMSLYKDKLVLGGKGFVAIASTDHLISAEPGKFPFIVSSCKALRSGKSIPISGQNIQNHEKEGGLILSLATLTYPNARDINYQYKISSFGNQWIDNGKNNDLVLAGLEKGEHNISIRAMDANGELITIPKELSIFIQPFWFNTLWFKLLSAVSLLFIAFSIYKIRLSQKNKIEQMRNDISRDLHDDIGSLLGSISIYSESALNQIDFGNNAEAISILDKIGIHARTMIDKMSDIVWSIHSEKDTLQNLSHRMKAHGQGLCAARNINFNFQTLTEIKGRFDMRERKNIFLIYKEFINNSLKHSDAKNIFVAINAKGSKTIFEFGDDGIGFDSNSTKQNGFGLNTMENRAKDMKGEISIKSVKDKGTRIQLTV